MIFFLFINNNSSIFLLIFNNKCKDIDSFCNVVNVILNLASNNLQTKLKYLSLHSSLIKFLIS